MTTTERETLEKDVIFEAEKAKRDYQAQLVKLARVGDKLEELGQALKNHPELVTPLPEPGAPDYREALNLPQRQEIVEWCKEVRTLRDRERIATQRKAQLGF
jgi:hypothetical protein